MDLKFISITMNPAYGLTKLKRCTEVLNISFKDGLLPVVRQEVLECFVLLLCLSFQRLFSTSNVIMQVLWSIQNIIFH